MKKFIKYFGYVIVILWVVWCILFVKNYYKRHYQFIIDNDYAIVDLYNSGNGFYLINRIQRKIIIPPSIVWYCTAKKYIIGCRGSKNDLMSETYVPTCKNFFIFDKTTQSIDKDITKNKLYEFLQNKKLECQKELIY